MDEGDRFRRVELPSGLTVIGEHVDSVRSLSIGVWVKVGARHEATPESGMSHFLEHMVFKGTHTRDAYELALSLESVGGHLDAFTGREVTCFDARALDEHLNLAVEVLADLVLNPKLDPDDVEKEKKVILDEIHTYEDTPDERIHDLFADVVWSGHPLGNRILGTRESVQAFTREDVARYHARRYCASNLLVAIAGRFDWERFVGEVSSRFGDAPPGVPPESKSVQPNGRDVVHHVKDLAQQYLCIGGRGLPSQHPDRHALIVLSTLLGGGMSSRLFQRVREQEGLAYSVYTYADFYRDAGIICAGMNVQPQHGRRVVALTLEEFERVIRQGVPENELRSVKAQLKGNLLLGLESTSNRMNRIARNQLYEGRFVSVDELVRRVDLVRSEDVQRVALELISRDRISLVALGPSAGSEFETGDLMLGTAA
ncbi:MAG: insulinase family protein [Candidatus Eisenbacteria bacterium]|uniref:Insulinase family protein n=1 Tax=Eiseniibacteriota bacterium TaxID=2212470 RepID=A0A538T8M7_UNCEI|nr:MAG: insulinase family protein [Candidatus Eisenbacteria bacterium]